MPHVKKLFLLHDSLKWFQTSGVPRHYKFLRLRKINDCAKGSDGSAYITGEECKKFHSATSPCTNVFTLFDLQPRTTSPLQVGEIPKAAAEQTTKTGGSDPTFSAFSRPKVSWVAPARRSLRTNSECLGSITKNDYVSRSEY